MKILTPRFVGGFNLVFASIFAAYAAALAIFAHAARDFSQVSVEAANAAGTLYSEGRFGALRESAVSCHRLVFEAMHAKAQAFDANAAVLVLVAGVLVWNFFAVRRLAGSRAD